MVQQQADQISLRQATADDADRLLAWRNDPLSRAASHNPTPIPRESHVAWLTRALADPARRIYIAEAEGIAVGSVRADWVGDAWLLSWTVAPEARGRGYGREMVRALAQSLPGPLRAEVKIWNVASARIARYAGLTLERKEGGLAIYSRTAHPSQVEP